MKNQGTRLKLSTVRSLKFVEIFKNSCPTSQKTQFVFITIASRLILFREMIAVCPETHVKHINTLSICVCFVCVRACARARVWAEDAER
jgi:hypothetical protein